MAWFKVDDGLWAHPKFLGLSDRAFRLWVRAGAYSAQHLTDGIVSADMLRILGAARKQCDELWTAGLWEKVADGGYRFHDWEHYQMSKEEVERRREYDRQRKKAWREAKQKNREQEAPDEVPEW